MANQTEMRQSVKELYPNDTWSRKVDRMSDQQVYMIYQRTQNAESKKRLMEEIEESVQLKLF